MTLPNLITSACVAVVLVAGSACKKHDEPAPAPATGSAGSSSAGAAAASTTAPDASADHITVLAHHANPKPSDPVRVHFDRFRVVTADFDPDTIDGGRATIEIDLSSLHTGSDERDDHLKSPSYLDVGTLATATITIDHVKHEADNTYAADATAAVHGATKTYPVTFEVLERKDARIRIKGTHTFSRLDFGIGTDPASNAEEQVGTDVTIEMVLTIAKT